ncbi:GNAT family N-acetyltransferase [Taibaiella koreensis]|uniref:GNAT family N-acetyltransferase n=1 Tax=Taibaiella koreensis TaxID=1268548 RepID=UPI000E59C1FB|nr:GNAT family N-acetyltransferase [Taibaiella koreensis]
MKNKFSIRQLDNNDSQQVINLILPIQQQEFGVPISIEDQPDLIDIDSYYYKHGGSFWGVFDDHILVGTIALLALGHHAAAIRKMFVRKEYRGKEKGIAQALFDHLIAYCREQGIRDIYLGTIDHMHAAHRFYERNGFEETGASALPSYFPRMAVDNVFYHLNLAPSI